MSQSYAYSDYPQQYYHSDPYNSTNSMHPPIQQQHTSYDYQNQYYNNTGVTPSAHTVNDSSVLTQGYTYSNVNYAPDTTEAHSSYESAPNHVVPHHPDSAGQIPHQGVPQYGDAAPGQNWTGPAQYPEVTTVQPADLHDQRRGSCASMSTDSGWYSHDGSHYDYTQPAFVEPNHNANNYQYQQQPEAATFGMYSPTQSQAQAEPMNFGMYSPTQHPRTQELAQNASYDTTNQWAPVSTGVEVPYGTLPIHEHKVQYEHHSSDGYQEFDNGSVGHQPHASASTQSQPPATQSPSPDSEFEEDASADGQRQDLFAQQRRAATYQHGLQAQQQLKYQMSGHLEQFEATHRRQESYSIDQNYNYTVSHDSPHHQNHPAHHHRQNSTSSDHSHRLASAPIVPSQARERAAPYPLPHASPVEEKKETTSKKPALACLFCRKRKIACGPPPPENPDRTCNQCLRRKQVCEYPTESRRGIRKTPKEPVPEEPTVHKFVHGDVSSHESTGPIRSRPRRNKRND